MDKSLPPCAKMNYDCFNCPKPLVAQTGRNDLEPCDGKGTLHFCRFATGSSVTPACSQYDLHNYACSHGGGSCVKHRRYRRSSF